jgi:hypothetical protein
MFPGRFRSAHPLHALISQRILSKREDGFDLPMTEAGHSSRALQFDRTTPRRPNSEMFPREVLL